MTSAGGSDVAAANVAAWFHEWMERFRESGTPPGERAACLAHLGALIRAEVARCEKEARDVR